MTERFDAFLRNLRDVAKVRHIGVVVGKHLAGERFDFGNRSALPPEALPCYAGRFDAAEQAKVSHSRASFENQFDRLM